MNRLSVQHRRSLQSIALWLAWLAIISISASCQQIENHQPSMQDKEQQASLTYESLAEFVGEEWTLDVEVINTLLSHPAFQGVPPVAATFGDSRGVNGGESSETTVGFFHLGQGWIEATKDHQTRGGAWVDYKSTGRTVSALAGLLPVATWSETTSTWKDNAPRRDFGGARITAIRSISGQLFPMEVGRSMSVEVVRSNWEVGEALTQSQVWEVTRLVNGLSVGLAADESVFEVMRTTTTIYESTDSNHSEQTRLYYVPSLGVAVRSGAYSSEYPEMKLRWHSLE